MAENRSVKRNIKRLQRIKTWQLLVLLLLVALLAASFLRLNNIGMIQRRTAVLSADKKGDEQAIQSNLAALQRYMGSHMNAESGPIYLEYSYQRANERLAKEAAAMNTVNNEAFRRADEICKQRYSGYSQAYAICNRDEQTKIAGNDELVTTLKLPDPDLFRYSFITPIWSPDYAGWTLAFGAFLIIVIILRLIGLLILKLMLRKHYDAI